MEPWREEAFSDELMHYGIKGMKWKKRKKKGMSDYERAARAYESNWRNADSYKKQVTKQYGDFSHWPGDVRATHNKLATTAVNSRVGKYRGKVLKQINRYGGAQETKDYHDPGYIRPLGVTSYSGNAKAKEKANKRVSKRVKSYNRKQKVKSFVNNLFKKKKKR